MLAALFGRSWAQFGAILLTIVVLVVFLGLNVSVIGLVEIPTESLFLVAELFGLIVALDVCFAATFTALEWRAFSPRYPRRAASPRVRDRGRGPGGRRR